MADRVKILIVEDEFMIAEDIAMRLDDFGYEVVDNVSTAKQALDIIENSSVDLALLDINISGPVDGIQLASVIQEKFNIPFIYLTSLASKAVVERAQKTLPSAFLLKPFNDRQVQIAIDMALNNFEKKAVASTAQETNDPIKNEPMVVFKGSLFLKKDSHFERLNFDDVLYLEAASNYTSVVTKKGRYVYSTILKYFEEKLPGDKFVRIHRSYIVNLDSVTGFEGGYLFVNDVHIPISKKRKDSLFNILNTM
ncbi:MAG: LytTR family transcriptional regulator DNA-binding domain-containing protein [Prolixibacteraceae bacterium]|jgi:DNA-binding LytR/AlgR family response regulator|nr:LytTR family transcriptional regulator DNA-binding domain-containing protein [Prolixibacteraceae bacterium]